MKTGTRLGQKMKELLEDEFNTKFDEKSKEASNLTWGDRVTYYFENRIAADQNIRYRYLIYAFLLTWFFLTCLWRVTSGWVHSDIFENLDKYFPYRVLQDNTVYNTEDDTRRDAWIVSAYYTLQLLTTTALDTGVSDVRTQFLHSLVFVTCIVVGVFFFAVLISFINESVSSNINAINKGYYKVATRGHTLILGWNEATVRVVCQIALLRVRYQAHNNTCIRRWTGSWCCRVSIDFFYPGVRGLGLPKLWKVHSRPYHGRFFFSTILQGS